MADRFPAAILAGGLGTRLHPLTESLPKALIDINGQPFIAHQLRLLAAAGVERVVLCLGHLGEMVQEVVGNGARYGVRAEYSFDGPALRGTGGAIQNARALLGDAFFVMYGDSYLPCDYARVQQGFEESGKLALMTVFQNEGQWDTSNVELEQRRIVAYDKVHRTPRMRHIDYGLGVFRRSVFDELPQISSFDLAEVYRAQLEAGMLAAFEVTERFYEIGSFEGVQDLAAYLSRK